MYVTGYILSLGTKNANMFVTFVLWKKEPAVNAIDNNLGLTLKEAKAKLIWSQWSLTRGSRLPLDFHKVN